MATYNVLEVHHVFLSHGIRLGNHWNQVDSSTQPLHHLDIKRLDTVYQLGPTATRSESLRGSRLDEVETGVDPQVLLVQPLRLLLLPHV
jgi:hypothetical protein